MSRFRADDRVVRVGQCFQAQAVRGSAVEDEKDLDVRAEMLLEFADRGFGLRIVSIGHRVALIGGGHRLQNLGMNTGIVVAGKAARRFHVRII